MPRKACGGVFAGVIGLVLAASPGSGDTWYVTPAGGGTFSGENWGNAFSNVAQAVAVATNVGDRIHLTHGTYTNASALAIVGAPGLTISGGYAGTGDALTNRPSILTRGAVQTRIVYANASTLTWERVTVAGGYLSVTVGDEAGAGMKLVNCNAAFEDCVITNNRIYHGSSVGGLQGAGIYASGGTLTVRGGAISENSIRGPTSGGAIWANSYMEGGGLWCSGVALTLSNVTVQANDQYKNVATSSNGGGKGSGLCLWGGSAVITGCRFDGNWSYVRIVNGWSQGGGGALYAAGVDPLRIEDSVFEDNSHWLSGGKSGGNIGGVLCLLGSTSAAITGSRILNNGDPRRGEIWLEDGALAMTNCLVAQGNPSGIHAISGSFYAENCTFADHTEWGLYREGATVSVKDSIAWGNGAGGLWTNGCTVTYSCSQEAHTGSGNTNVNPLFVNAPSGDYHLQSVAGSWHKDAANWVEDLTNSLCIDAGDPAAAWSHEPDPNGSRRNMGAYGNTGYASKTGSGAPEGAQWYVTPTGAGSRTGVNWAQAFSNVQDALDVATGTLDRVCLRYGVYALDTELVIDSGYYLTIAGGYAGVGDTLTNRPSVLTRGAGASRIVSASGQILTLERLTFANGLLTSDGDNGAGASLVNCTATVRGCVVTNNRIVVTTNATCRGAGLYAAGGDLAVEDTVFADNELLHESGPNYHNFHLDGGALYCSGVNLDLTGCRFDRNRIYINQHWLGKVAWNYGGAVYALDGRANVSNCVFGGNYNLSRVAGWAGGAGGALFFEDVSPVTLSSCVLTGNWLYVTGNSAVPMGGTFYSEGGDVSFDGCRFFANGLSGVQRGDIWLESGTLGMTNCVAAKQTAGGVIVEGGAFSARNCTFADNEGWGIARNGGTVTVKDSIAWGNTDGGIPTSGTTVSYTCSQEAHAGDGNLNEDPLFVNATTGDYHLKGMGGAWRDDLQAFKNHGVNSPCIDAGDPTSPYERELLKNGGRVNMGAYGNTPYASCRFGAPTVLWIR